MGSWFNLIGFGRMVTREKSTFESKTNQFADAPKQVKRAPKEDCWHVAHLTIGFKYQGKRLYYLCCLELMYSAAVQQLPSQNSP